MKKKLRRVLGRYWVPSLVLLGVVLGNATVGYISPELGAWECGVLGVTKGQFALLTLVLLVLIGVLGALGDLHWKKMLEKGGTALVVATLIPAFILMQLPASAQTMQVVPASGLILS